MNSTDILDTTRVSSLSLSSFHGYQQCQSPAIGQIMISYPTNKIVYHHSFILFPPGSAELTSSDQLYICKRFMRASYLAKLSAMLVIEFGTG